MLTLEERNDLILDHMTLAEKIAYYKKARIPPQVSAEELVSAAYLGLVDAASKFNPKYKSFSGYASIRITGAICDFLRELGWGSKCQYTMILCGNDSPLDSWADSRSDNLGNFREIIKNLDSREQDILFWYYGDNYNMREIGEKMGLSESRVCQIINRCKTLLRNQWDEEDLY